MRGVEYVILALRPFQEVELDEAGNCVEIGVTAEPDVLEVVLAALFTWNLFMAMNICVLLGRCGRE